jgi:Flp pilus assembly protein TadG
LGDALLTESLNVSITVLRLETCSCAKICLEDAMIGSMKRLWKDRRGNALAIAAAAFPLLVGAAGLAADTIQWTLWKRELQRAADSAALAGVYDRVTTHTTTGTPTVVNHDLTLNHHTGIGLVAGYPEVTFPADDIPNDMRNQVRVVLAVTKPLPFSSMFMSASPTIIARSTAASVPGSDEYCVVALERNGAKTGLTIGGSSAIEMDCGMISNSPSANSSAINNGNASNVIASVLASVGGMRYSQNWTIGKYDPYASAVDDPYADINPTAPEMSGCAANPPSFTEATVVAAGTTSICASSLSIGSTTTNALMSDGTMLHDVTIYLTGKNKNIAANAVVQGTMNCTHCTIILTNKDMDPGAKIGTFDMNAQAKLNISAPESGYYKGIAVMQDRRQTDSNGASSPNKFNGGGSQVISGALYFPSQAIDYLGNGTATAICTRFVARRVTFTGNSATSNKFQKGSDCPFYADDPIGGGRRVRLVA